MSQETIDARGIVGRGFVALGAVVLILGLLFFSAAAFEWGVPLPSWIPSLTDDWLPGIPTLLGPFVLFAMVLMAIGCLLW